MAAARAKEKLASNPKWSASNPCRAGPKKLRGLACIRSDMFRGESAAEEMLMA